MKKRVVIKKTSLKTKIIILIIIVSIFPVALMSIMATYNYDNILKERFISYSEGNMNRIVSSINTEINDMNDSIVRMLQDPTFNEMLRKQPNTNIESIEMFSLRKEIKAYLSTIVFAKKNYDIGGIFFYENTQNIYYTEEAGLINPDNIPYMNMRNSIKDSREAKFFFDKEDDQLYIYLMQQILHMDTFEPIGMLYYRIDPNYLENIFEEGYTQSDETLFMFTKDGRLMARKGTLSGEKLISDNRIYESEPNVYVQQYNEKEYYLITDAIPALDLTVITLISTETLTSDSRKVIDLIIILCIAIVPLFIVMAYFLYGNIVKPVNHLIDKMNVFEGGQFDIRIDEQRDDEFGYMYEAFNDMTSNINTLVNDVYIEELARKDAEISALQEQINPHFLYNTLESINWRAQLAGEQEIALMIQALSKLMDASINRSNEKFVTMREEVSYSEQYMYLMQMRYTDLLVFRQDVKAEVMNVKVPKLIIQPLLENAVKYGIEPVGEGLIELLGYVAEDYFVIEVKDSGKGMTEEGLKKINKIIEIEKRNVSIHKDKRESVGLQNVARRIQLIYGEEAEILVYSKEESGTCITIKLPMNVLS